jgi:type VI secretion system protein VasD
VINPQPNLEPPAERPLRSALALGLVFWAVFAMTGCHSKPPKPVTALVSISLHVQSDVNPDPEGHPKPIVLHVYQLKADTSFVNSSYFALVDDEKRALGGDLLSREEKELAPGETRTLEVPLAPETRFIAAVGEYRDLDRSVWQAIAPVPAPGPGKKGHGLRAAVEAARARVAVSVTP